MSIIIDNSEKRLVLSVVVGVAGGVVLLVVVAAAILSVAMAIRKSKEEYKHSPNCSDSTDLDNKINLPLD